MIYVSLPALADEAGTTLKVLCEKARDLGVQAWFRVEGVPLVPRLPAEFSHEDCDVSGLGLTGWELEVRESPPPFTGWAALPLYYSAGDAGDVTDPSEILHNWRMFVQRVGALRGDDGGFADVDAVIADPELFDVSIDCLHVDAHGREALLRALGRADRVGAPPPGMKPPDGVTWEDVAALSEPGAPPELVTALRAWSLLRQHRGKVLPVSEPARRQGPAPYWLGELVKKADPNATDSTVKRLATVINPATRKRGGARRTQEN